MKYSWKDFEEIFSVKLNSERNLAELQKIVLEVTINIKQDRMSLLEHLEVYKSLWNDVKKEYDGDGIYFVEYCSSGQAHIHGYLEVYVLPEIINYDTSELLRMFARSYFLKLPRKYFKQFANAKINEYFKLIKTPAVTINIKNILCSNWQDYITKNAR